MKGKISLKTIRGLLSDLSGQCPHLGEWVTQDRTWAFKTAPPTTGGMYAAIMHCTLTAHTAGLMHDHVCTPVYYIYIITPRRQCGAGRRVVYPRPVQVPPLDSAGIDMLIHIDVMWSPCIHHCTAVSHRQHSVNAHHNTHTPMCIHV